MAEEIGIDEPSTYAEATKSKGSMTVRKVRDSWKLERFPRDKSNRYDDRVSVLKFKHCLDWTGVHGA